jgi:hypothetical protein
MELIKVITDMNTNLSKIGGKGVEVLLDETAICNGRIITCPSATYDEMPKVQWILGGVERNNGKRLFLTLVPDSKKDTLLQAFKKYIAKETILVTDGYPSYVSAVKEYGSVQIIVNHVEGFKNEQGFTTNKIENVWSHLKTMYRSRNGMNHNLIPDFVEEFVFRKINLQVKTSSNFEKFF